MAHHLITVTAPAERDLRDIFLWSETEFGNSAAERYQALVERAMADLADNRLRPGSKKREGLQPGIYTYHLASSRENVSEGRVKSPRHFLGYRIVMDRIEILRVLHDSRDLDRHVPRD